jgi:O-antigen/teichoic acid export membrane protein
MGENPLKKIRGLRDRRASRSDATQGTDQAPLTPRYGVEARRPRRGRAARAEKTRRPGLLARVVNGWWNRLIGAVFGGRLSDETEQYLAHQTTRDYVCNTLGQTAWGALFPLLTLVCTWFVGAEQAGLFSMAFTVGTLLLFLANYGVRTYQVSDLDEMRSFLDYQVNRLITCALAFALGWLWCRVRGYDALMFSTCMGVVVFRCADGLADVYEGRLQQRDKLYLAGLSQTVRCVLGFVAFTMVLLITRDLALACIALAAGAVASLVLLSLPLAYFETERSLPLSLPGVGELFRECFPLFAALFFYNLIDSMPKFAMEGALSYDNQLYYSAMFFPANSILMIAGFVYKPQLVRLARIWDDPDKHKRFDLLVLAMLAAIALITVVVAVFMGWLGIPLLSLMYGIDFEQFRSLTYVMVAAGGICACIDFVYQIITVLRAQRQVMRLYLVALAFSMPVALLLVNFAELSGAVVASLVSMAILFVLLVSEYATIRRRLERGY